jgi:hypothetical protein
MDKHELAKKGGRQNVSAKNGFAGFVALFHGGLNGTLSTKISYIFFSTFRGLFNKMKMQPSVFKHQLA